MFFFFISGLFFAQSALYCLLYPSFFLFFSFLLGEPTADTVVCLPRCSLAAFAFILTGILEFAYGQLLQGRGFSGPSFVLLFDVLTNDDVSARLFSKVLPSPTCNLLEIAKCLCGGHACQYRILCILGPVHTTTEPCWSSAANRCVLAQRIIGCHLSHHLHGSPLLRTAGCPPLLPSPPAAAAAAAACPSICQIKLRTYLFVASWTWRPDRNLIDTPLQLAEGSFGLQISFPFYMLLPCFSPCCRWLPRGTLLTNVFQNHQILGTPSCESGSAACKCSRSRSSRRHRISRCNSPY